MSFTITFGWWLVPAFATVGLMILAVFIARWLAGGDDDGTGLVLFPASTGALLISVVIWVAYFAVGAP